MIKSKSATVKRALLGGVLAVAGTCGAAFADDKVLVVGTTGGDFATALTKSFFKPFEEKYGVEVVIVSASTPELTALLRAQTAADNVELDITTSNAETIITDTGLYEELDCSKIPSTKDAVPGTCSGVRMLRTVGAQVLAYSTEAFPNGGPTSWADFFDTEKFPGARCLMAGGVEDRTPMQIALLADGVDPKDLYPLDLDRAVKKLKELKPHISAYYSNFSMSQQLMRDGECVMSPVLGGRVDSMKKEGAPVEYTLNQSLSNEGFWSIPKGAKNKELSYKFLDFFLQNPEAHLEFFRAMNYATPLSTVQNLLTEEEKVNFIGSSENYAKVIQHDSRWIAENKDTIYRAYARFLADN